MPAVEPGAPTGGDLGLPPLETVPGPSNPWLACGGAGGAEGNKPAGPVPDFAVDPPPPVNWVRYLFGLSMQLLGLGLLTVALALAGMVAVGMIVGTGGFLAVIGGIAAVGAFLFWAGSSTAIGAIDPPALDHRSPVALPRPRRVHVSPDAPAELRAFIAEIAEVERLASAEIDLIDRARAAARAKDDTWYETHIRTLYAAQGRKQQLLRRAGGSLKAFVAGNGDLLKQAKVADPAPLRDALNPITNLREELDAFGVTFREVDALLAVARTPSPLQRFLEERLRLRVRKAKGSPAVLLAQIADELATIEAVDWDAFGGKPKTAKAKASKSKTAKEKTAKAKTKGTR